MDIITFNCFVDPTAWSEMIEHAKDKGASPWRRRNVASLSAPQKGRRKRIHPLARPLSPPCRSGGPVQGHISACSPLCLSPQTTPRLHVWLDKEFFDSCFKNTARSALDDTGPWQSLRMLLEKQVKRSLRPAPGVVVSPQIAVGSSGSATGSDDEGDKRSTVATSDSPSSS